MGIQLEHRNLNLSRTLGQGFSEIVIDKLIILPSESLEISDEGDSGIFWSGGIPVITSVEPIDGFVSIKGYVKTDILYLNTKSEEESTIEYVTFEEPKFEININIEEVTPDTYVKPSVTLTQLKVEKADSRSLSVEGKIMADVMLRDFTEVELAVEANPTGMARLSSNKQSIQTETLISKISQNILVRESFPIVEDELEIGNKLKCGAKGTVNLLHATVSDGKVTVDAEVKVQIAHEIAGKKPDVSVMNCEKVSVHETFDVPEAKRGMKADLSIMLKEINIIPSLPDSFEMEAIVAIDGILTSSEEVDVVSSIFSECDDIIDSETRNVDVDEQVTRDFFNISLVENVHIDPEIGQMLPYGYNEMIYSTGSVNIISVEAEEEELSIRGYLIAYLTCNKGSVDGLESAGSFSMDIPIEFSDSVEIPGLFEDDRIFISTKLNTLHVERNAPSRLNIDADIELDVQVIRPHQMTIVTEADLITPIDVDLSALTFYVCSEGDTLNKVARRYKVTPDRLAKVNSLEDGETTFFKGKKLFIPAS